jgi:hypothetical protein
VDVVDELVNEPIGLDHIDKIDSVDTNEEVDDDEEENARLQEFIEL